MNADDLRDQEIEKYIHNRMNDEDRLRFEKQMQTDGVLKKEVEALLEIKESYDGNLLEFKKKIISTEKKLEKEDFFEETRIISIKRTKNIWIGIAASIIIIAGVFYFFDNKTDIRKLAMNAAVTDFTNLRGENDKLDSLFEIKAYQKLIDVAIQFKDTVKLNNEKIRINLYIIRSYIILNLSKEAITLFNDLPEEIKINCDLKYSLALAYLIEEKKLLARDILTEIVESKCYPQEKNAVDLLKKF